MLGGLRQSCSELSKIEMNKALGNVLTVRLNQIEAAVCHVEETLHRKVDGHYQQVCKVLTTMASNLKRVAVQPPHAVCAGLMKQYKQKHRAQGGSQDQQQVDPDQGHMRHLLKGRNSCSFENL